MATYTVKEGDTLSEIAQKFINQYGFSSTYDYVDELAKINNLKDPDYIVIGQNLKLDGEATPVKSTTTSRVRIDVFGLQSNTDSTMYISWTWSKDNTENYQIIWYYDTGDSFWFIGSDSTVKDTQATYSAPSNAIGIKVKIKPISKTHKVNDTETAYWTAGWSEEKSYYFSNNPPKTPPVPTVTIEKLRLKAEVDGLGDLNAKQIEFQVVKDNSFVVETGKANILTTNYASYSCEVAVGSNYRVRCRAIRDKKTSDWSDYSDAIGTAPTAPSGFTKCKASSESSVYFEWNTVKYATSYDIEYAEEIKYFDGSSNTTTVNSIEFTHYEITGLESGKEYFFRLRAVNEDGTSSWTKPSSVVLGKPPAAPTTWSSTTTAVIGEPLTLYWVHNSEDGSNQTYADLELIINGNPESHIIRYTEDEDDDDKNGFFSINTSRYTEGAIIKWRVRTAGVTLVYGDWSIERSVEIYSKPSLALTVTDSNDNPLDVLTSFPLHVSALASPNTQAPVGYHITITSNDDYETVDNLGNTVYVNTGDQVFSRYYDISQALRVNISANDLSLENNMSYTLVCFVSMDSGLTAESSIDFTVHWTDEEFEPNAEIGVNLDDYTAYINPYCKNEHEELIEGIMLSVYRREFDGSFTELATGIDNLSNTFITDPHPALDFARYRIVATTVSTGKVSYYDVPGYPVGCKSIIIQWNEEWSNFDVTEESELAQPPWTGSMLNLQYNVDVSEKNNTDKTLVEYIGRKHPVSYYGTQLGTSSTMSTTIPKSDKDTLYALRRLAVWMGDVYIREPSGIGYWANVDVSFNQKHRDTTIPVSLDVKRVAGGA